MKPLFAGLALALTVLATPSSFADTAKPTIVLVHGAFADASSWNGVIQRLEKDGYPVIAAANPLRGVQADGAYVSSVVASVNAPVVLVGHSYGGSVISEAANARPNVKALVYVSAFAPDAGETAADLAGKFPGGTLGDALAPPAALPDGSKELSIDQAKFPAQFAADVPPAQAALMAATQRPITVAALNEPAGEPAWKHLPSWFVYGDQDKNIPPQALQFMAKRAHAQAVTTIKGGSHVVMVSHPDAVARVIEQAAGH
ncbi:alpha/beta hydrolase [Pseudomonas sp. RIT-PI-S]|uniref:alpha/beta fold hydrolase n=1 Tax=Pseudomonas sp. RIT-PI-S TaxID=3035295 RepID=UPI0021D9C72F|nr:alpha/beta hydrolase [Pseudomonas sp. RIT-PI-S]